MSRDKAELVTCKALLARDGVNRELADYCRQHPNFELLLEPALSICCFRYVSSQVEGLLQAVLRIGDTLVAEQVSHIH